MISFFTPEVRKQYDERAAALPGHDALGRLGEVTRCGRALVIVEVVQHVSHRVLASDRRKPAIRAAEAHRTHIVTLAQGDVAQQEGGIQAVVKLCDLAIERAQSAS